jgi:hypothetical protein
LSGVAIVRGTHLVAMSAVGATVRGMPPESVRQLHLVEETGLGTFDLERIEIIEESVEKMQKNSKSFSWSKFFSIQLHLHVNGDIQQQED